MLKISKENFLLDALYEDAHHSINPGDDECWNCGGEGYTFDCIDGCCADAESGCEDCARKCSECARFEASIERHVRLQIIRDMDVPLAKAWLKRKGRWNEKISDRDVLINLHAGRCASKEFTDQERADSACWIEGLM